MGFNVEHDESFWKHIDLLISESEINIDRPKGSIHPKYGFLYPVDYGFLKGTSSMDGGGVDVWRGSTGTGAADALICTIDMLKKDSEIKILVSCTDDEKQTIYQFHNQKCMRGIFVPRYSVDR
jgi:inorganic pyrophosphatase